MDTYVCTCVCTCTFKYMFVCVDVRVYRSETGSKWLKRNEKKDDRDLEV